MSTETSDTKMLSDLRRPFTPAALKFKVQAGGGTMANKRRALCIAYIDARLTTERLNHVVGLDWSDTYEPVFNGAGLACRLTVRGVTRIDVGEPGDSPQGKKPKALVSDAFKRAGVKWGVGVSIYAIPSQWLEPEHLTYNTKPGTRPEDQKVNGIKPSGIELLRSGYAKWLEMFGEAAFGDPIDHGDALDAAGDYEVADRIDPETGEITRGKPEAQTPPLTAAPAPETPTGSPKDMAVAAFVEWMAAGGQSASAKAQRTLVAEAMRRISGTFLPGTWSGRGEMLYGIMGDAIQSEQECLAELGRRMAELEEKEAQS